MRIRAVTALGLLLLCASAEAGILRGGLTLSKMLVDPSDPEEDLIFSTGVMLGKAGNYRTWEVGAFYQVIEKDALFAQLIDSDFAGGNSDSEGWVLRGAFAPQKNWVLNATYFLNKRNRDLPAGSGQTEIDYDRLQLDFNVKF